MQNRKPFFPLMLLIALGLLAACQRPAPPPAKKPAAQIVESDSLQGGAISTAPVKPEPGKPVASKARTATTKHETKIDWSPLTLASGQAWLSCELDYIAHSDGTTLTSLEHAPLTALARPCVERGVLRLRYKGLITADFTALVERVTRVADELKIGKRVLDLDSPGGQVEDAIRAGDGIAESHWTIWVREGSQCHSACVLLLSAGDMRMIAGRVGIHRIIRMSSTATTRAELNAELRVVQQRVRDYLERNGAATAVADLMMAVPNRSLRLLSAEELKLYGLDGVNPAQDDLDRLRLIRKCGEDFVVRRDNFAHAFDLRCRSSNSELDALNDCGLALRKEFDFPDHTCPAESPLSEFDTAQAAASNAMPMASKANATAPGHAAETSPPSHSP